MIKPMILKRLLTSGCIRWLPCRNRVQSYQEKSGNSTYTVYRISSFSLLFNCLKIIKGTMDPDCDYLREDHLDDEDEDLNAHSPKVLREEPREDELEREIMQEVIEEERRKEDTISGELENKLEALMGSLGGQNEEETVRSRMSELALNKILVYTHGKSEFRLVAAHHHMGLAYLAYRCYEQAIDHLTLALKKNSKLTHLQQTKLYHSVLLTSLSKCYFEIASYEDALEVLGRALEIQTVSYKELNEEGKVNVETLRLTACCHLKLKNPKKAHEYIKSALEYSRLAFGEKSIEVAKLKAETGKIFFEEKNYECAIEELNGAIEMLIEVGCKDKLELIDLEELLASYYEKNSQPAKLIQTLLAKLELVEDVYSPEHKNTLKLKRSLASIMIKNDRSKEAVNVLEQILESEEKVYGPTSSHVGKTLKMLGLVCIGEDSNEAEKYLKQAQKILQDQGNAKLVKEIKSKLTQIKENRQAKINNLIRHD